MTNEDFTLDNTTSSSIRINWNPQTLKSKGVEGLTFILTCTEAAALPIIVPVDSQSECLTIEYLEASMLYHLYVKRIGKTRKTVDLGSFETWPNSVFIFFICHRINTCYFICSFAFFAFQSSPAGELGCLGIG